MMTKRDPHGNIVRGTIAALGAAVGGADAVTVLPFSAALGLPDAFARRIARNTQTILIEEANIHRVADPAAGSGAIEALTDALCEVAWSLFQEIEREGGAARALETGSIQQRRGQGAGRARSRCRPPQGHRWSAPATSPISPRTRSPCWRCRGSRLCPSEERALAPIRLAEPFERLRDRSDALSRQARRKAEGLPRLSRTACGFQCAGEFRQEPVRVGRHRGGGRKGRQPRETIQGIGRQACLPVLLGQGL